MKFRCFAGCFTFQYFISIPLINARQRLEAVNQLEKWAEDGVILINMSGTAHSEATAGGNPQRTRKANQQIFTATPAAHPGESIFQRIAQILFPGSALSENQRNDVRIIADAVHYAAVLVTADGGSKRQLGGILGNREQLKLVVGAKILSPDEAVTWVRQEIADRDAFNRRVATECGGTLPEWMGKD